MEIIQIPRTPSVRASLCILPVCCLVIYISLYILVRPSVLQIQEWNEWEGNSRRLLPYSRQAVQTTVPSVPSHVTGILNTEPEKEYRDFTSPPRASQATWKMKVNEFEEVKVQGSTPNDWCIGLKTLYPSVLNISRTEHLQNISAYYRVINPFSVRLIYNPKSMCPASSEIHLLSIVKSRVENARLRQAIRVTWGKVANSANNRLVFSLGYPSDRNRQRLLQRENSAFKDIVQGDFIDNYYNNTLKTTMGIHWISTFCSTARFIFFVDDDVLVNFKNLLAFYKNVSRANEQSLFSGNLKVLEGPFRHVDSPYYMPVRTYPYNCYPPYLSGAVTITSGFVVQMLNTVIPFVRKFRYDDVFIGIVIQKLGIRPQKNDLVSIPKKNAGEMTHMIASHGFKGANEYIRTYRNMTV